MYSVSGIVFRKFLYVLKKMAIHSKKGTVNMYRLRVQCNLVVLPVIFISVSTFASCNVCMVIRVQKKMQVKSTEYNV